MQSMRFRHTAVLAPHVMAAAWAWRAAVVTLIDAAAALAALFLAFDLRLGDAQAIAAVERAPLLFLAFAPTVVLAAGLFRLEARPWRYMSLADLGAIARTAVVALAAYTLAAWLLAPPHWLPRSVPIILFFVLVVFLGGVRALRRGAHDFMAGSLRPPVPAAPSRLRSRDALVLGSGEDVDTILRWLERDPHTRLRAAGVLSDIGIHRRATVRGVPILGGHGDLKEVVDRLDAQGRRPACVLFAGNADRLRGAAMVGLVATAQQLGLDVAHVAGITALGGDRNGSDLDLRYLDIAALIDRPQRQLPTLELAALVTGRRVMVTGAGGTIGRELVRQIAALDPAELQLLDAGELALYEADLELRENFPRLPRAALLCSIRQRAQLIRLFARHRPELVFHAAALKHVPLVEANLSAGMLTNVIGTRNVADAARACGVRAMVQVSTDKAVNPVGFMGLTKRLGELYAQALDLAGSADPNAPRFLTVRFGNVLGSSGSLIPLFQRQLARGGPLTVTHPDMTRFFMTVGEAVQLVLHSASRGVGGAMRRGRIFVLDMGRPVRILDVARRMIRLAGLEPDVDVGIEFVGLRPGEKLYEELFDAVEARLPSPIPGVFEALPRPLPLARLRQVFDAIERAARDGDDAACNALARALLDEASRPAAPEHVAPVAIESVSAPPIARETVTLLATAR